MIRDKMWDGAISKPDSTFSKGYLNWLNGRLKAMRVDVTCLARRISGRLT